MSPNNNPNPPRRAFLIFLLIAVPFLLFIGWSQASLNLSFIHPKSAPQTILLVVVSAIIFLAFLIFALILLRILLKLYVERRSHKLGSRFKTKMVIAFLALTLVPACFLFAFSYGLLNRSIDKWFGIPFDVVHMDAMEVVRQLAIQAENRSRHLAVHLTTSPQLAEAASMGDRAVLNRLLEREVADLTSESAMFFTPDGVLLAAAGPVKLNGEDVRDLLPRHSFRDIPQEGLSFQKKFSDEDIYFSARPLKFAGGGMSGVVVAMTRLPLDIARVAAQIQSEAVKYNQLSNQRRAVRRVYLFSLSLLTVLILFVASWFALFFSKQVTVPIQALADATHEVSSGNLDYRIPARADDELGTLIQSFNEMTRQLKENRLALESAAQAIQKGNQEMEERGNIMEAILENIPTAVVSFDPQGQIMRTNSTAERMFGHDAIRNAHRIVDLFNPDEAREVARLFRRALRQGVVTRQMEVGLGGRRAFVALTLSSIRARHGAVGSLLVLEDLTELLQAQKAVAWQEVAQRIAHEIKNPLTPIQLSAERIRRWIGRADGKGAGRDLVAAVEQSSALIEREVATLKTLVDEFSHFARFPASRPVYAELNGIVAKAVQVFDGRLGVITLHCELAESLPAIQADPDQMRRVLVNLIDNAAEALENSPAKEIWVRTLLDSERDMVVLVVADSGPGISLEDRERLFLPFFSTKRRGTGLGLAIVSRIISEHKGTIRVEENRPLGTKFIIELPMEHAPAAAAITPEKA
ncbi:MAG: HAMP domain-containing protein [Acidobacteria bacterium]|nr:MAG: HAMP domain-containing protein [Acidobacteriota bacterium]